MKTNFLFPHRFKTIGWIIFIPSVVLGILYLFFDFTPDILSSKALFIESSDMFSMTNNNLIDEISGVLIITGLLMIAFSKEKTEDEYIARIRLESLVRAVYINYIILIIGMIFIYGTNFLFLLIFNMFTILIFFIIRFNWVLYQLNKLEK